jgi:hypothetical protein
LGGGGQFKSVGELLGAMKEHGRTYDTRPGTSEDILHTVDSILAHLGEDAPKISKVSQVEHLGQPAQWTGHFKELTVSKAATEKINKDNDLVTPSWLANPTMVGNILHELTHARIGEMPDAERRKALDEAKRLIPGARSWLSLYAEMGGEELRGGSSEGEELLAELGSAYLTGKKLPSFAIALARSVWPHARPMEGDP